MPHAAPSCAETKDARGAQFSPAAPPLWSTFSEAIALRYIKSSRPTRISSENRVRMRHRPLISRRRYF
jgi:hypothetical protein